MTARRAAPRAASRPKKTAPPRGRFITLEGGEGAGKSTQIPRLAEALHRVGLTVRTTREPGGTPAAERIRKLLVEGDPDGLQPMTEALLHFAARAEHLAHVVRPALVAGEWVISDRFADSTMAYQGYGHGLGRRAVQALYRATVGDFAPDLTVILDLPVEQGLARAGGRPGAETRYERMGRAFHERLRRGFLDIARREPKRCAVIDAAGDADATTTKILAAVGRRFRLHLDR
ncbi:MAG: dTMP kinase [Rhodospirillales bacterium]|nr:dTMP kinase [Rhodospirillales bacterium]